MKKSVLSAVFALTVVVTLHSQALPYDFVVTNEPYLTLTNATELSVENVWDLEEAVVPIGFHFHYSDAVVDSFYLLGYLGAILTNPFDNGSGVDGIFGYGAYDLDQAAGTLVRYKTDGVAPNRICKIEWYKAGFSDAAGSVSFQIWLYEKDDVVQIRIGPSDVPDPVNTFYNETSPLIGLMVDYTETIDGYSIAYSHWVVGPGDAPVDSIIQTPYTGTDQPPFGCDGVPKPDLVLTFYPAGVLSAPNIPDVEALQLYPNPATDLLNWSKPFGEKSIVQIFDGSGRLLYSEKMLAGTSQLALPANLPSGTYYLRQVSAAKTSVAQFVKG